jgi:hypothetical protein
MFGRDKKKKLIRQQLRRRGLLSAWWPTAEAAITQCESGNPLEALPSGAGPVPARSIVALLRLEPFVEGSVDWTLRDELTEPGRAFYPPNNEMELPKTDQSSLVLQEWFFPTGDAKGFEERLRPLN